MSAAVIVEQSESLDKDLEPSETTFIYPLLVTLGLTYFFRSLSFQPYDRDPRGYSAARFDDDDDDD